MSDQSENSQGAPEALTSTEVWSRMLTRNSKKSPAVTVIGPDTTLGKVSVKPTLPAAMPVPRKAVELPFLRKPAQMSAALDNWAPSGSRWADNHEGKPVFGLHRTRRRAVF